MSRWNVLVKDEVGAVGLTESHAALLRWMVAGPKVARLLAEFECQGNSNNDILPRHEQDQIFKGHYPY